MPCPIPRSVVLPFAVLLLGGPLPTLGQERLELDHYCLFDGSTIDEDIFGFESDSEARGALNRVMRYAGLEPNFVIKAANVPNAAAVIDGSTRLILYNQTFMRQVRNVAASDWAAISILAHEIGHHLQGHTLERGGSTGY